MSTPDAAALENACKVCTHAFRFVPVSVALSNHPSRNNVVKPKEETEGGEVPEIKDNKAERRRDSRNENCGS